MQQHLGLIDSSFVEFDRRFQMYQDNNLLLIFDPIFYFLDLQAAYYEHLTHYWLKMHPAIYKKGLFLISHFQYIFLVIVLFQDALLSNHQWEVLAHIERNS